MKKALALLLVVILFPSAAGQVPGAPISPDVAIEEIRLDPSPVIGIPTVVSAMVYNPGPGETFVRADFSYGDGSPLTGDAVGSTNGRTIASGARTPINLTWIPPADRTGKQTLQVVISGTNDPNPTNNTQVVETLVKAPKWSLTIHEPPLSEVLPAGYGFIQYTLRNEGNALDKPLVSPRVQPPWYGELLQEPGWVAPGAKLEGVVLVNTSQQEKGVPMDLELSVQSALDPRIEALVKAPVFEVNASLLTVPRRPLLEGPASRIQVLPGETFNLSLRLQNNGSLPDVFLVNTSFDRWHHPDWIAINLSVPGNATRETLRTHKGNLSVPLLPGESRVLQVTAIRNATLATHPVTFVLNVSSLDAPSLVAVDPAGGYRTTASVQFVPAAPELEIEALRAPSHAYEDDSATLEVSLTNRGRLPSSAYTVEWELHDRLRLVTDASQAMPPLGPGQNTSLQWRVSTNGLRGDHVVVARIVAPEGEERGATLAQASLPLRRAGLSLKAPESIRLIPGTTFMLASLEGLVVRNGGSGSEEIPVRLQSDLPWLQGRWNATVPAGADFAVPLVVEVPPYPGMAGAEATLVAWIAARPDVRAERTVRFLIEDSDPPELELLEPEGSFRLDQPAVVRVRARDATGVDSLEAIFLDPTGARALFGMQRDIQDPSIWEVRFTPTVPGAWSVEVRALDKTPQAYSSRLSGVKFHVEGSIYQGVQPLGFAEGTPTRALSLGLREVVNGTTARVEADLGEGYRLIPFPFAVPADSLPDGRHTLRVRATSIQGHRWEGAWNVTIDRSPPVLGEPRVERDSARLRIEVEAKGATNVTAAFETATGRVSVPIPSGGGDVFSATITPPETWRSLHLLAMDAAGNPASVEVNMAQETPGVGLLALLGIFAAAGLGGRRRPPVSRS